MLTYYLNAPKPLMGWMLWIHFAVRKLRLREVNTLPSVTARETVRIWGRLS